MSEKKIHGWAKPHCQNCDHEWFVRTKFIPKCCPKCGATDWNKDKKYKKRDFLYKEYIIKNKTAKEIGKEFGVHITTIFYQLDKFKIKKRNYKIIFPF